MIPEYALSALANHVWQSTLFASAAWLLALSLGKHHAQPRHWIWLTASVKFLVPFSLLIGNHFIAAQHGGRNRADVLELALGQLVP